MPLGDAYLMGALVDNNCLRRADIIPQKAQAPIIVVIHSKIVLTQAVAPSEEQSDKVLPATRAFP